MAVKERTMGSSRGLFKSLFGALAFVGCVWLLLGGGILESGGAKTTSMLAAHYSLENLKHMKVIDRERLVIRRQLDLNYMSKRRVPNGPDPIHNRRAGNSRQPPGQSLGSRY
ncbi:hypothetical protein AAG906_035065 [Vitis piasezkii]|uniref:CLAVATA3/ESR (CLE)-related protein 25 n=1 Tax=Vitis vinifera TaxID=29760 RepID=D7TNI7_VITVI|eukprot:XP_003631289.2 PREDICTED: CLAVATA3/ESR (CLE)-related protein 25 [Vitis vinifera]